MPPADDYDAFLVDLDGCVWLREELVPGAVEALGVQQRGGKRLVFVTNDTRSPAAEHASRLRAAGLDVPDDRVVTAGDVAITISSREQPGEAAFVIGTSSFMEAVEAAGHEAVGVDDGREAGMVLVGSGFGFGYPQLKAAIAAIFSGASFYASNRDRTLPMPDGLWPGTGALVAAIEYATQLPATLCGKPERHIFDEAIRRIGGAERPAMIGDRLDSDIAGAAGAGIETILVLTGASSAEDAETADVRPNHILASLADLGDLAG